MDFRYETKDEVRNFHKQRVAFIIINNEIHFIKNSEESHWEYCQSLNISKETFNTLTRGYYFNGRIVFYNNNFTYDNNVIEEGLKYIVRIKEECNIDKAYIYFGLVIDKTQTVWPCDYYYGMIDEENKIIQVKESS